MSERPEVSIIMPVRNEAGALDAALEAVCSQATDVGVEIIVIDGHSTDGTRQIVERWAARDERLRVIDNPERGIPQALNNGLRVARGRYLVRVDGHSSVPSNYVQTLVNHIRSGACEGAGGHKRAVGRGHFGRAVAAAHGSRFGIGDSKYHYSDRLELVDHIPFGAYITERARAIGGWNETLRTNEDYEFDFRYQQAGGRLLFDPGIVFEWRVRETPSGLVRQYYSYGRGKFRALARHPSSLHLRWCIPPTLVVALLGGALFSWLPAGRLFLVGVAGAYAIFLVGGSLVIGSRVGMRLAPHAALALAAIHLSWGAGFLVSGATTLVRGAARRVPGIGRRVGASA